MFIFAKRADEEGSAAWLNMKIELTDCTIFSNAKTYQRYLRAEGQVRCNPLLGGHFYSYIYPSEVAPKDFEHSDFWRYPARWQRGEVKPIPEFLEGRRAWASHAIGQSSPFFKHFQSLAREPPIVIGLTFQNATVRALFPLLPRVCQLQTMRYL